MNNNHTKNGILLETAIEKQKRYVIENRRRSDSVHEP
jgi:hypothetical protein